MPGTPYFPDKRIAYHADGSAVFSRRLRGDSVPDPNFPGSTNTVYTWLPWEELSRHEAYHFNGDRRHSTHYYSTTGGAFEGIRTTGVGILFPEPMTITGVYFTFFASNTLGLIEDDGIGGDPASNWASLWVSRDTTALDDGKWESLGRIPNGVTADFNVANYGQDMSKYDEQDRPMVLFLGNEVISNPNDILRVGETYRRTQWSAPQDMVGMGNDVLSQTPGTLGRGRGIFPIYQEAARGVRGLQLAAAVDAETQYDDVYDGFRLPTLMDNIAYGLGIPSYVFGVLHIYGYPTRLESERANGGLEFVTATGSPVTAKDLNIGDVTPATTTRLAAKDIATTGPLFVHNYSTKTAKGVKVRLTHPLNWSYTNYVEDPLVGRSAVTYFARMRLGSGPWVTEYEPSAYSFTEKLVLDLGDIPPGGTSAAITVGYGVGSPIWEWLPFRAANLLLETQVEEWT